MAQIKIEDETVMIRLSRAEKFGALHGDLRFPLSAVRAARVVDKPSKVFVHRARGFQG